MKNVLAITAIILASSSTFGGTFDVAWNERGGKPDLLILVSDSALPISDKLMEGFIAKKRQEESRPYVRFWRYPERFLLRILELDATLEADQAKYGDVGMLIMYDDEYESTCERTARELKELAAKTRSGK